METAIAQFLLSLSDLDVPLKMWVLVGWSVAHISLSFRAVSKCLRIMSVRLGRASLLPPVSEAAGAACERGAAASAAPGVFV